MLGAGGHARVLLAALKAQLLKVSGCIAKDRPEAPWPADIEYLGSDDALLRLNAGETALVNGVGSIRSMALRKKLFELGKQRGFTFVGVRHPSAVIDPTAEMGEGAQVMAGAVVQCSAKIGHDTIINTGALIDHDCWIGAHSQIAPGACLGGAVKIGEAVHVGLGARIIQGVNVGDGALIAAGAVVISDVGPATVVAGVPAQRVQGR